MRINHKTPMAMSQPVILTAISLCINEMQTSPQSIISKYYDSPNSCVNSLFVFLVLIGKTGLCDT